MALDTLVREETKAEPVRQWRSRRLGLVKKREEYKQLPSVVRSLVDYLVRAHESREHGITISQRNEKLLAKFDCTDRTIRKYLKLAVEAGVLTVEARYRGAGTDGGRTTNCYRLNDALVYSTEATDLPPTVPATVPHKKLFEQVEALSSREHVEALSREHAKDETQLGRGVEHPSCERESDSSVAGTAGSLLVDDHRVSRRAPVGCTCPGCGASREVLESSGYCSDTCRRQHERLIAAMNDVPTDDEYWRARYADLIEGEEAKHLAQA
jgi:hypothetical protein